ncbi:MAG TPA: hypothetical protein VM571_12500, partial [Noviherbaspirillum sp.]|nr:hypothetical protein [Noviherbaspirillum sp.]
DKTLPNASKLRATAIGMRLRCGKALRGITEVLKTTLDDILSGSSWRRTGKSLCRPCTFFSCVHCPAAYWQTDQDFFGDSSRTFSKGQCACEENAVVGACRQVCA